MTQAAGAAAASLERYVPRLATDWDDVAPDRQWQEIDGSLCFVDISGFTNLSEKLSRRGRIGAEELTAVLNYVFGKMLEIAYQQGGSLLKFGGDALLLLYSGEEHAKRAASAAVEMRSALRGAVDYETSVGRLRLRMSVGIHSGPIHLFRAGSLHHELVIAGPAGTMTTRMEKTADPGEIVVSDGTKERLPDGAVGDRKGDGWLLRWRKAHQSAPGPVVRDHRDPALLESWIPGSLREYLRAGEAEPEHRIANVGFVRYCGVDNAMETQGPEWVARAINETMATVQQMAEAEGVTFLATDINEDGGKAILVTGAPAAQPEDEARLLRAVRRMVDAGTPLDLHVGVNRGHVFTGEVGTPFRSTYTVMGDTVNVAARLMAAAHATQIFATPNVLDQSGTLFASSALEPFHVKGKEEPLRAYAVGEELGERSLDERDELPFVGRADQLNALERAIADAERGTGSVHLVVGDAGLGKSRLVREATSRHPDIATFVMRSEPYGSATPFRPWRDRIRDLLGIDRGSNEQMAASLTERLEEVAPDLLPMAPLVATVAHIEIPDTPEVAAIEPRFRQGRLTEVVVSLMDRMLTEPMALVIEDAHWMDESSANLASRLTSTADQRPWAIVVTRRGDEGGFTPEAATELSVSELSDDESRQLVIAGTEATPLHPGDVDSIVERVGGNPLFIGEILRIVAETGSADQLPDSLGTLVSTSIDALPPLTRRILRYASVLGRSFRAETVNEILAEDALELDAATRGLLSEFLEESGRGRYRFRTAMVRDVAYDGLSFRRREDLHRRAARAIAATAGGNPEDAADQLAMHYHLGNDPENTWHYARIAGDRAARAFANGEAAVQYERALAASRRLKAQSPPDVRQMWVQLGDVRERAGLFDGALDAYRSAGKLVEGDAELEAELLLKRAWVRERAANYPVALSESTRARNAASGLDEGSRIGVLAQVDAFQAVVRMRQGKPSEAERSADRAQDEAIRSGDKAALARAINVLAWTRLITGDPTAADLCQQALGLYEEIGDLAGQNRMAINLGVLSYFDNRWDDAVRYYEMSKQGAERVGNYVDAGYAASNLGEVLVNRRDLDRAEECLADAARVLRATGELSTATYAEVHLARVLIARGDIAAAEDLLNAVIDESEQLGFAANAGAAAYYLAEAVLEEGKDVTALDAVSRAREMSGEVAEEYALLHARVEGLALCRSGRVEEAIEVLLAGIDMAAERGQLYDEGLLRLALADVYASTGTGDPKPLESSGREALRHLGVSL